MSPRFSVNDDNKTIAVERIQRLFELAEEVFEKHPELADRYVKHAWRIKTRHNVRLSRDLKRKFCRKCISFWRPGNSCRVRIRQSSVTITCLRCGRVVRLPYRPKKMTRQ